ncbi:hypothetical protein [Shinella sp.]|jgi:hypothetical protein|uniref:hypothetical protein n=1 Tax=Shinella sp. TaxID=1870904 RepID=UPI003F6F93AC
MKKWLLSLLGVDLLPIVGLLVVFGGAAVLGAYVAGRNDASDLCNAAALEAENIQLRKDIAAMRKVSADAAERATADAAALSILREQVDDLEHAFSSADNSCRLTPDDARRLRAVR